MHLLLHILSVLQYYARLFRTAKILFVCVKTHVILFLKDKDFAKSVKPLTGRSAADLQSKH